MNNYYKRFPKNYFNGKLIKASKSIELQENVLVAAAKGFGTKTFVKIVTNNLSKDITVLEFNLAVDKKTIFKVLSKKHNKKTVVVLYNIHELKSPKDFLEKLSVIQIINYPILCFVATGKFDCVENPIKYSAKNTIFFQNHIFLKAFSLKETKTAIKINETFYNYSFNGSQVEHIYKLSGGIPRLIKHICKVLSYTNKNLKNVNFLLQDPPIIYQLDYLAKLLVTKNYVHLTKVGIINKNNKIKSKLLKLYFKEYVSPYLQQEYPLLTELELKLLTYFYLNKRKVVSIDKISSLVGMNDYNFSLFAIYKSISRLNKKINNKFIIKSVRGRGYTLIEK